MYSQLKIIEWTRLCFLKGKLGIFHSFQVTYGFQGELYEMKEILLEIL